MNNLLFQYSNVLNALGYAILYNMGVGIVILLLIKFIFAILPRLNAAIKYKIAYSGLIVLFFLFLYSFVDNWNQDVRTVSVVESPMESARTMMVNTDEQPTFIFSLKYYLPYISVIYLIGLLLFTLKLNVQLLGIKKLRYGNGLPDIVLQSLFDQLKNQFNINKHILLQLTGKINTPLMFGFFKPIILLPASLVIQLDSRQLEAVLLHELAHIKRHDYLWNILQSVIETILFFNPVAWVISSMIRKEREYACDDLVLGVYEEPKMYAETLLALSVYKLGLNPKTLAISGNNRSSLFNRIKRITMKENTSARTTKSVVMLFSALLLSLSLVAVYGQKSNSKKEKATSVQETASANNGDNNAATEVETAPSSLLHEEEDNEQSSVTAAQTNDTGIKQKEIISESHNFSDSTFDEAEFEKFRSELKESFKNSIEELTNTIKLLKETDWTLAEKELAEKPNKIFGDSAFRFSEDLRAAFIQAEKEIYEAEKELIKAKTLIQNARETELTKQREALYMKHLVAKDSIRKEREKRIDSITITRERRMKIAEERRNDAIKRREDTEVQRKRNEAYRKEAEAKRAEMEAKRKELQEVRDKYRSLGKVDTDKIENFLIEEKLIKKGKGYTLHYKKDKLYINNVQQPDEISKKASPLFGAVQDYHYITNKSRLTK